MKIKKGDMVEVIAGNDKGLRGEVLRVLAEEQRVVVQGRNIRTKHQKERQTQGRRATQGGRIRFEAPIHVSNVQLVCPKTNRPTRVSYKVVTTEKMVGEKKIVTRKKIRIAQRSGVEIK